VTRVTVYLPGASGRSQVFRPVAERVGRSANIFVDYPGFGDAPPDSEVRSLSELFERLVRTLPDRFDLVSLSMGGILALRLALEHPERVRKLVLVATSGGVDVARLGGVDWRPGYLAARAGIPRWFVDDRTDVTDRLGAVTAPTLLVFGGADPISPVAVGEFLQSRLPSGRLAVIPGATHDVVEDYPDEVARLIAEHLA
jgi:pimeloyl-ACP methyl ester carboxylesterase